MKKQKRKAISKYFRNSEEPKTPRNYQIFFYQTKKIKKKVNNKIIIN
jgi:hypothetical protein